MLPDNLRSAAVALFDGIRAKDSPYHASLSKRLEEILAFNGPDIRGCVRSKVSLADWNYFQVEVNSAAAMRQAHEVATDSYAPALAIHFGERLTKATENQRAIDALMGFGWTFALTHQ